MTATKQQKQYLPPVVAEDRDKICASLAISAQALQNARTSQELLDAQTDLTIAVGLLPRYTALASGVMGQ